MAEFANRFGAPPPLAVEFFGNEVVRKANELSFGKPQLPTLDIGESRYVISFGADFLGTWNSPVAQNIGYGEMRQGRPGIRGKFVQVEYRMSQTGANADEWVAVKPGTGRCAGAWDCQCHHEVGRAESGRCGARGESHRWLGIRACGLHTTGSGKKDQRSSRSHRTNRERICGAETGAWRLLPDRRSRKRMACSMRWP